MPHDPHRELRDRIGSALLTGAGATDPTLRARIAAGEDPADLHALLDRVREHAPDVTDAMIADLRTRYDDDALFEIILSAAYGETARRLDRAIGNLDLAFPES